MCVIHNLHFPLVYDGVPLQELHQIAAMEHSIVQYKKVQYRAVKYSTVHSTVQDSTAPAPEDPPLPGQLPAVLGLAAGAPLGVDQAQVRLARQVGRQVVSVHNRCLRLPVGLKTKQSF